MCSSTEWIVKPWLRSTSEPRNRRNGLGSPAHEWVTRFRAGMRNDCGEMSQPGLTTGALAARFATESSTLSSTTE